MVVFGRAAPLESAAPDKVTTYAAAGVKDACGVMNASIPLSAGTTFVATLPSGPASVAVFRFTVSTRNGREKRSATVVLSETPLSPSWGIDAASDRAELFSDSIGETCI